MYDYCPRVMHLKRCAGLIANYKGEYKCAKCAKRSLSDSGKQFNPKTVNSIMVTPEWSIKPKINIRDTKKSPLKEREYG